MQEPAAARRGALPASNPAGRGMPAPRPVPFRCPTPDAGRIPWRSGTFRTHSALEEAAAAVRLRRPSMENAMTVPPVLPGSGLIRPCVALLAILLVLAGFPREAPAETHDTCAGFIDSVPAVISTQGVWCLRGDVSTAQTSGSAIEIAANNVTIDCNGYKIGGLAAGSSSAANGIYAYGRMNITVRNCNIRGFLHGISLFGSNAGGHLVEDNRLDGNLYVGMDIYGDNNTVQRNQVYDTGGGTSTSSM